MSSTAQRVLISGASIAGPALAFWLRRYGFDVTVLERAPELRRGGQNIDVRGAGREVARRMGLEQAIRDATTGEQGTRFVRDDGTSVAEFPAGTNDSDGATAELEILRGDLAALLVDRSEALGVAYRWGDSISGLQQDDDRVTVSFEQAVNEEFDLVIAADGIGSTTRGLVFGDEPTIRSLGLTTSWLTIPRTDSDDDWWRWYTATGGRSVTLRPDPYGTIRAALSYLDPADEVRGRSTQEQRTALRARFADAGWETPRILTALDDADDLYSQQVAQVHAPRWSSGRVAMIGDAAYCASPVSGMGTSLALVGAYVLAGELAAHVHHRDAFAGYERILRPYVEQAQDLPPGTPRLAHPKSRAAVAVFHTGVRLAGTRLARALGAKLVSPPAEKIELPDYTHLEPAPLG